MSPGGPGLGTGSQKSSSTGPLIPAVSAVGTEGDLGLLGLRLGHSWIPCDGGMVLTLSCRGHQGRGPGLLCQLRSARGPASDLISASSHHPFSAHLRGVPPDSPWTGHGLPQVPRALARCSVIVLLLSSLKLLKAEAMSRAPVSPAPCPVCVDIRWARLLGVHASWVW